MTINFTTLFTRIGKLCHTGDLIVTANATTIPNDVEAFLTLMQAEPDPLFQLAVINGMDASLATLGTSASGQIAALVSTPIQRLIVSTVSADVSLISPTLANCITELITQMDANGESLDSSAVTISTVYGSSGSSSGVTGDNVGTGCLVWSTKGGDGLVNEFSLAETLACVVTAIRSGGEATWTITGEAAVSPTAVNYPGGSGTIKTITSYVAASGANLVTSGTFEDSDATNDNLPNGWIAPVATLGTTVILTPVEQQTVTINGTPTSGYYTLSITTWESITYTTAAIPYNAAARVVQTALSAIPGLGGVSVTSTGGTVNQTHTIVFYDAKGPNQLAYTSALLGGTPTITINTTLQGSYFPARSARCLQLVGDGAQLTTLQVPVNARALTQYAVNLFAVTDLAPNAGTLVVDLCDGIGGTVLEDQQGVSNTFSINCTTLLTAHRAFHGVFRLPAVLPAIVYLRLRLTAAIQTAHAVFIDELSMTPMVQLYNGGPFVAGLSGPVDFVPADDTAAVTVANTYAGNLHSWLNRALSLSAKNVLFPTAGSGSQSDALIV
jgi:hypothetical protein